MDRLGRVRDGYGFLRVCRDGVPLGLRGRAPAGGAPPSRRVHAHKTRGDSGLDLGARRRAARGPPRRGTDPLLRGRGLRRSRGDPRLHLPLLLRVDSPADRAEERVGLLRAGDREADGGRDRIFLRQFLRTRDPGRRGGLAHAPGGRRLAAQAALIAGCRRVEASLPAGSVPRRVPVPERRFVRPGPPFGSHALHDPCAADHGYRRREVLA